MMVFPTKLLRTIARSEEFGWSEHLFGPYTVPVYECWPIDEFNALLEQEKAFLYRKYGFNSPEHSDWVTLRRIYKFNPRRSVLHFSEHWKLLNSWALKDPVAPVPSSDELSEELEWTNCLLRALSKKEVPLVTFDKLHHDYVAESCEQMTNLGIFLKWWKEVGSPSEQGECFLRHDAEKADLRKALKEQQLNELDARERLYAIAKAGAPQFLLDAALGNRQRETDILKQIHTAMSMC